MNLIERLVAKAIYGRMEGKMKGLRTWGPILGSGLLVSVVVLRLLGMGEVASAVESIGGAVGLSEQSPVGIGELTAAGAALTGILLKLRATYRKARLGA